MHMRMHARSDAFPPRDHSTRGGSFGLTRHQLTRAAALDRLACASGALDQLARAAARDQLAGGAALDQQLLELLVFVDELLMWSLILLTLRVRALRTRSCR
eukprot:2648342-Prymnesium_polylepis.1